MANYRRLALVLAAFVVISGLSIAGSAFAYQDDGDYSHSHATAMTNPSLVCGDHKCAPGESSSSPAPVVPVRGN